MMAKEDDPVSFGNGQLLNTLGGDSARIPRLRFVTKIDGKW